MQCNIYASTRSRYRTGSNSSHRCEVAPLLYASAVAKTGRDHCPVGVGYRSPSKCNFPSEDQDPQSNAWFVRLSRASRSGQSLLQGDQRTDTQTVHATPSVAIATRPCCACDAGVLLIKNVTHTRLPSVGFRSWSRCLAVSLQVMWVINPAVGCHYFPPGLQLPPQPLKGLLPILLLGEQRHNGCEQFA